MNIVKNEIKKIFNITNLIIVGIATVIIWVLFISFYIEYFPNGSRIYGYNNSVYMLENYGLSMDENEFKDFKKMKKQKVKEADEYLSSRDEFVRVGLLTYDEFEKVNQEINVEGAKSDKEKEQERLINKVNFEDYVDLFWEIPIIGDYIDAYENKETQIYNLWANREIKENKLEAYENRHNDIVQSENLTSPLDGGTMENYNSLIEWINLLIIITVAIMTYPIFMRDNKNKVNYIQYSSKEGRRLFNKKIIAGIISSIIIVTVQLAIFFIIYKSNNTYMFWNCSINSVFNYMVSWFDITFGQYIMITVSLTYISGIIAGVISMAVSSKVKTYISLIGIQIPILFVFWKLLKSRGMSNVTSIYHDKYTVHLMYIALIAVSIFIIIRIVKRERKLDI